MAEGLGAALPIERLHLADAIALIVQQSANRRQNDEVSRAIKSAGAAGFGGFDERKFGFPKPKHMLSDAQLFRRFGD